MIYFKKNKDWINILGIYVLISVGLNLAYSLIKFGEVFQILWFCDFVAIILGISLIKKHKPWISAIFIMSLASQSRWIIDFILQIAGKGMGRTSMMLDWGFIDAVLAINLHSIMIPISLYAAIKLGFSKKSWLYVVAGILLLPLTFVVTDMEDNINCVFYPCDQSYDEELYFYKPHHIQYLLFNVMGFWLITFLLTYALMRWILFKKNIYENNKKKYKKKS